MAFPSSSLGQQSSTTTAATSHSVFLATTPVGGELLLIFLRFAALPGVITFTGYTQIVTDASDATDDTTLIYYRQADGTEGGTAAVSTANSVKGAFLAYTVTGAVNPATQAPQISTVAIGTTTANTANPTTCTPTGGAKDYLWYAFMGQDGELNSPSASPTNYSTVAVSNSGTGGAVATNCTMGAGFRQLNAASEDPGAFTHAAAATGWTAWAVAVHPPAAGATSDPTTWINERRTPRRRSMQRW